MRTEINLLQQTKSVEKKKSAFFKFSLFLLIFCILFTIGEIGVILFLKGRISSLGQDQSATLIQIKTLDAKRVKFQTLKERLVSIGKILPESAAFNTRINALFRNIPFGVALSEISTDGNSIDIRVVSNNLQDINSFLEDRVPRIVKDKEIGVIKSEIDSVGISADATGYTASVKFTFK